VTFILRLLSGSPRFYIVQLKQTIGSLLIESDFCGGMELSLAGAVEPKKMLVLVRLFGRINRYDKYDRILMIRE
jgi:hypothetical protein